MFRYRRYRVFLAFAVIAVFALYEFGNSDSSWKYRTGSHEPGRNEQGEPAHLNWQPRPQVAQDTQKFDVEIPAAKTPEPKQTPPPTAPVDRPVDKVDTKPETSPEPKKPAPEPKPLGGFGTDIDNPVNQEFVPLPEGGQGALEVTPLPSSVEAIHWTKLKEHFPVATESLIKLPSGKPKPVPKIQHNFKKESPSEKVDREAKLNIIQNLFKRSWDGYKEHAWLQDELSPVSGKSRNPFAGWGATLVDTLDTLWIMGLKDEFVEAVEAVKGIDFTTTARADIPLFETTIRYLGGFLAAYDMSGKKHQILLDKSLELAELLISAFDTPNRMPETYYYWRPDFSSNPHRASNRVVLAEIGSLSVEFTRLAQITGQHKYYDAIARITDNFDDFQNHTRLPGMWPTYLDASGCKRTDWTVTGDKPLQNPLPAEEATVPVKEVPEDSLKKDPDAPFVKPAEDSPTPTAGDGLSPNGRKMIPLDLPSPLLLVPNGPNPTWKPPPEEPLIWPGDANSGLKRRQLDVEDTTTPANDEVETPTKPIDNQPQCEEQGFAQSSEYGSEEYTLGGMSDSTYEYLPKEYLLLGGHVEKYRTMYEQSMDVVKKHLLFRPMLPNEDDVLFSGKLLVPSITRPGEVIGDLQPENAHLTCFAGGMFAMGAKLFDRPDDLDIAKKLTEGCIYSYNMTATGIMPEAFDGIPCESRQSCAWNTTKWWDTLDPRSEARMDQYKEAMVQYKEQMSSASAWYEEQLQAIETPAPKLVQTEVGAAEALATPTAAVVDILDKRQLTDAEDDSTQPTAQKKASASGVHQDHETVMGGESEEGEGPPTKVQPDEDSPLPSKTLPVFPVIYSPKAPLSHEEYVQNRIQEERLPQGVVSIQARSYILRPEAIESVWYMYRITGDPYYREAGWRMFEAVNAATTAEYGNSAIDDVTKTTPSLNDEMESFWLAETLKYFYLLFTEEDVVSLDEWVLNTEAHPLKRPT